MRADMVCFRGVVVSGNSNRIRMALSNSCLGNLVVRFCVRMDEMCSVVKYDIIHDYYYTTQVQVEHRRLI